ncbi:MAG: hypothetical protein J4F41_09050, partial [Alphaproteobacteria bacterium]|nr:hypothetical protein [Alphaproteobacteria bacterium]
SKHINVSPREIDPNVEIFAPIDEKLMSSILTKVMQDMAAQDLLPEMNIVAQQAAELYNRAITSNESDMS